MNGRRVIIIGVAAALLVSVVAVTYGIHRRSAGYMEDEADFRDDGISMGIDYGGKFDEFNYNPDEENDIEIKGADLEDRQTDDGDYAKMEPGELIEELRKQREIERGGIKQKRSAQTNISDSNAPDDARTEIVDSKNDDFVDNYEDFEDDGESENILELGLDTYEIKGYVQDEVRCNVSSREEAEAVAVQISGTLLSWNNGVAIIKLEGSVDEFLEQVEQQGNSLNLYRSYY